MPTVVGVRLRFAPKTLWFDPAGTEPAVGDQVVVETERGHELGIVAQAPFEVPEAELPAALKPVARIATEEDLDHQDDLDRSADEAMPVFREFIAERKLDMKPVAVEYLFDGDKIVFYFSAEERVDFRDLVRDLAARFHKRIDLRQIGVRDEARLVGGIGHCGQQLCCVRFSGEFQPVSIRMAKEQDLPLNPLKISGLCGRLMCCLRYEYDAYKDFKSRAPKRGAMIETPAGDAKVTDLNTPRETVTLRFEGGDRMSVPLESMSCCKGSGCPCAVGEEEFAAISAPSSVGSAAAASQAPTANLESGSPGGGTAPDKPKEGGRRRRRRRGSGSGKQSEGGGSSNDSSTSKGKQASGGGAKKKRRGGSGKQGGGSGEAKRDSGSDASGSGGSGSSGRRRRRRRKRSGGGEGSGASTD